MREGHPFAGMEMKAARRNPHKHAEMCAACLFGHDDTCESKGCTCVCNEDIALKTADSVFLS